MFEHILSLLALVVIGLTAFGLGRPTLRGLGIEPEDVLNEVVWSVAIGLIVAGMILTGLGLLGLLYVPLVSGLTSAGCLWGLLEALRSCVRHCEPSPARSEPPEDIGPTAAPWAPPPSLRRGVVWLAAMACLGSLLAALAPPTAGDALCYHLELPKRFLLDHRISFLPDQDHSTFPLLAEMWYLWGLALDGPVAAQLIHWGMGVLLGLATVVLAAPILGRSWASVAGALVLLVPAVNNQMTAPLNDLPLAAMATLAVAAWWRAAVNDESRRWFLLAGLAAGGAIATKYLALAVGLAVAAVGAWLVLHKPQSRRHLVEGMLASAIVAISVGGVWYVRAAWHRGNPVFPFLTEAFVQRDPSAPPITLPEHKAPLGRHPLGMATAAWHITIHPERFGGRGHQLGVVFLAVLPGLAISRRLRGLGMLLGVAGVYWVLWYLLRQNVRFLLPIVPLLCIAAVWVWAEMGRLPPLPRQIAAALLAVILGGSAALGVIRAADRVAVACCLESRHDYLRRHEPTWPAATVANRIVGEDSHLLSQDYRAYYFPCRVTRENVYRRRTAYDRQIQRPADFSRLLRQAGFTHLLLAENAERHGIQFDDTLSRLADAQLAADPDALLKLTEYEFRDADGALRRYRLMKLP